LGQALRSVNKKLPLQKRHDVGTITTLLGRWVSRAYRNDTTCTCGLEDRSTQESDHFKAANFLRLESESRLEFNCPDCQPFRYIFSAWS
jgi:hypothetical protein